MTNISYPITSRFNPSPTSTQTSAQTNNQYVEWVGGHYSQDFDLTQPKSKFEQSLEKEYIVIEEKPNGDFIFTKSFGFKEGIDIGNDKIITINTILNVRGKKDPNIEINFDFFGPEGIFGSLNEKGNFVLIETKYFDAIGFKIDDYVYHPEVGSGKIIGFSNMKKDQPRTYYLVDIEETRKIDTVPMVVIKRGDEKEAVRINEIEHFKVVRRTIKLDMKFTTDDFIY
jgi:hypothetical protein